MKSFYYKINIIELKKKGIMNQKKFYNNKKNNQNLYIMKLTRNNSKYLYYLLNV